jgi:guanine deaminase
LGLDHEIGTLDEGTAADVVVLDARASDEMKLRAETVETLAEELFLLMVLGDDRAVVQTYVAGAPMKG